MDDVHLFLSMLVVPFRYITNGLIWFQIKSLVEDFPVIGHVHSGWFVGLSLVFPAELAKRQYHVQVLSQMVNMIVYWGN